MTINVGINGLGIMGRYLIRAIEEQVKTGKLKENEIKVVAFNDLFPAKQLAPLLKFDSVYGYFDGTVEVVGKDLIVDGKLIDGSSESDPTKLNWMEREVDIVYESTGYFTENPGVDGHLKAGAKKIIISAPSNFAGKTFIFGVNTDQYNNEKIISNASCTTNCLAPLALSLYKEVGPFSGLMTTIHAYTADQKLVDAPHSKITRGYGAAINMIPTTTGAAKAIGKVIPELDKRLNGLAIRVPIPIVSLVDLVVQFKKDVTKELINGAIKKASETYLKGILEYKEESIVSSMIIGSTYSSIFDAKQTMVTGNLAKVLSWYDNVSGYSHRVVDLIRLIGTK